MKTAIELTASARRKLEEHAVAWPADLCLREWVQKGDLVEFAGNRGTMVFIVRSRRIRVEANGSQVLIFELDHPPRPAVR